MYDPLKLIPQEISQWLVAGALGISAKSKLGATLIFFLWQSMRGLVLLALLLFLFSLLRTYVPRQKIAAWLGHRAGAMGNALAAGLGFMNPTAICSSSVVPLFVALVDAGVPLGTAASFLIAAPFVNITTASLVVATLGGSFALTYALSGFAVAVLGGVVLGRWWRPEHLRPAASQIFCAAPDFSPGDSLGARARFAWKHTRQVLGSIWTFLLLGFLVAGALNNYIPQQYLAAVATGNGPLAVLAAVLVGLPLFSSIASLVPIAAALLQQGMPAGTLLAFMLATTGISIPGVLILRQVLQPRPIAQYVAVAAVLMWTAGTVLNLAQ